MITDDRRAFKRSEKIFSLRYSSTSGSHKAAGDSVTRNISTGGVFFESIFRFEIGEKIDCRLKIPGQSEELRFLSRVVRCETSKKNIVPSFFIAVEFVECYKNSDVKLRKIISR